MPDKLAITNSDPVLFRGILEALAANPSLGVIANRYPWQAKMISEKLLEIAKAKRLEIRMLSGRFPEGFYNNGFGKLLAECRDNGCPFIRLLIWQKDVENISPVVKKLADDGKIEVRVSDTDEHASVVPHFLLVGENAFRQEAGHPPFTKETIMTDFEPLVPARADFNDPETGKKLKELFDKFWGNV